MLAIDTEFELVLYTEVIVTEQFGAFSTFVIVDDALRLTTGLDAFGIIVVLVPTILGTVTIVFILLMDVFRGKVGLVAFAADIIKLPPATLDDCKIVLELLGAATVPRISV